MMSRVIRTTTHAPGKTVAIMDMRLGRNDSRAFKGYGSGQHSTAYSRVVRFIRGIHTEQRKPSWHAITGARRLQISISKMNVYDQTFKRYSNSCKAYEYHNMGIRVPSLHPMMDFRSRWSFSPPVLWRNPP